MAEELEMTPERIKKIEDAYRPIDISGTFIYVPVAFRDLPIEKRPIFSLKKLDSLTVLRSEDKLYTKVYEESGKSRIDVSRGAFMAHVCILGIIGWRNYFSLKFEEEIKEKLISMLPADLLRELANAISERREMTEDEKRGLE